MTSKKPKTGNIIALVGFLLTCMLLLVSTGCAGASPVVVAPTVPLPTLTKASPTLVLRATSVPSPTSTATAEIPSVPTANPTQAAFLIKQLLLQNDYCLSPCIWGIVPGETTLEEAQSLFIYLGSPLIETGQDGDLVFYSSSFGPAQGLGQGLSYWAILTIRDHRVSGLQVYISTTNNVNSAPVPHKLWAAYSPENVLRRYGPPSSVEFVVSQGPDINGHAPRHWFMYFYYQPLELIFEYALGVKDELGVGKFVHVCPPTVPIGSVGIWLGKEPDHPPDRTGHRSVEELTGLSLNNFYEVVGIKNGCFDIEKKE